MGIYYVWLPTMQLLSLKKIFIPLTNHFFTSSIWLYALESISDGVRNWFIPWMIYIAKLRQSELRLGRYMDLIDTDQCIEYNVLNHVIKHFDLYIDMKNTSTWGGINPTTFQFVVCSTDHMATRTSVDWIAKLVNNLSGLRTVATVVTIAWHQSYLEVLVGYFHLGWDWMYANVLI